MASPHKFRANLYCSATGGLPPSETTIAELVKAKGYSTAVIGMNNFVSEAIGHSFFIIRESTSVYIIMA